MLYAIVLNPFAIPNDNAKSQCDVRKNRQNELFPLISFKGHVTEFRGHVFYCRRAYVVWQSFEKIGAETAPKASLEKN